MQDRLAGLGCFAKFGNCVESPFSARLGTHASERSLEADEGLATCSGPRRRATSRRS